MPFGSGRTWKYLGLRLFVCSAAPLLFQPFVFAQGLQYHTADKNQDNILSLREILRVVQFYNVGALSCDDSGTSEDGYLAGSSGNQTCSPHSSDYSPQDWSIGLDELLRLIQLYNACALVAYPGTEDDFLPVSVCDAVVPQVAVQAGSFVRGEYEVNLSAYAIGRYEVTNQQMAFVLNWANEQGYIEQITATEVIAHGQLLLVMTPDLSFDGNAFVTGNRGAYPIDSFEIVSTANHPVSSITWYGAVAFCNWLSEMEGFSPFYNTSSWEGTIGSNGYRLPTEAEWERAAAWDDGYHWLFGNSSDVLLCIVNANYHFSTIFCNPIQLLDFPYTTPVGYFNGKNQFTEDSPSPVGCYDMSGNVYEWCHDWYQLGYYSISPSQDPLGPASGTQRVARGGGWGSSYTDCSTISRFSLVPADVSSSIGFRVARYIVP